MNKEEMIIFLMIIIFMTFMISMILMILITPSDLNQANKILSRYDDKVISIRIANESERLIWFDAQEFIVEGEKANYHLARNTLSPFYPMNRLFEASPGITPHYGGGQGFP